VHARCIRESTSLPSDIRFNIRMPKVLGVQESQPACATRRMPRPFHPRTRKTFCMTSHILVCQQLQRSARFRKTACQAVAKPWGPKHGRLVLADGTVMKGRSFGASGTKIAEVVFNTSLSGYQEIMSDPSYRDQMVCFTYPHVGNTGINDGALCTHESDIIEHEYAQLVAYKAGLSTSGAVQTAQLPVPGSTDGATAAPDPLQCHEASLGNGAVCIGFLIMDIAPELYAGRRCRLHRVQSPRRAGAHGAAADSGRVRWHCLLAIQLCSPMSLDNQRLSLLIRYIKSTNQSWSKHPFEVGMSRAAGRRPSAPFPACHQEIPIAVASRRSPCP
jgi:hypothetical protein